MIVSGYLSDIFCWAVGGTCFLHKKESYICLEMTSEIGKEPQFNVRCVRDGSYFIFTDRRFNNCFPVRWKRVNNSHNKETLLRSDRHIRIFVEEKIVISVLSWFTRRPEHDPKDSRMAKREVWDSLSHKKQVMSSANKESFVVSPPMLKPLIEWSFLIYLYS